MNKIYARLSYQISKEILPFSLLNTYYYKIVGKLFFPKLRSAKAAVRMSLLFTLLFSFISFGAKAQINTVTGITVDAQSGNATYGTGASVSYLVTLTPDGSSSNGGNSTLTLNMGTLPAGVSYSFSPSSPILIPGSSITPVTATLTLTSSSNVNAGNYIFTVSCTNNPLTSSSATFVVNTVPLTITADNQTKAYGAALPTFTFSYSGFVNGDAAANLATQPTASTTADATSNVGSYPITPSGASSTNYTIFYTNGNLAVGTVPLIITASDQTKAYGATLPTFTFSYSGFVNGDAAANLTAPPTATTSATAASNVGNYLITPGGASSSNYTISYTNGNLAVGTVPLIITAIDQTKAYGAALPTFTFSYSGFVNGDLAANLTTPPTATTSATSASNVGNYPITPSGASSSNYTISYTNGNLAVGTVPLIITADNQTKVYGALNPPLTVTYSGFVSGDNASSLATQPTATTSALTNSPVGTYPITASGGTSGNYTFSYIAGTLTVTQATLTVTASPQTKVYGAANPALTVAYSGFVGSDNASSLTTKPTATTTAVTNSPVGTYPITASGGVSGNYTFSYVAGTLTVTQATLTVTASPQTKVYGAVNPALTVTYSGFVGGDNASSLTTQPTATTTAVTNSPVGTYPITVSGGVSGNYTFTYVGGILTVTKATLTVTADAKSKIYGVANPALTVSYSGFVGSDNASSLTTKPTATTTVVTNSPVGTYPISTSGGVSGNYTFSYVAGTLTVTQANLTVTANPQTKVYGAANPALPVAYSGFVGGDNASSLTTQPTATTTAVTNSPVGTYPITISGGISGNYTFTYVGGTLTVTKAPLTITANNGTKVYGSIFPTGAGSTAFTPTGLQNGENIGSITISSTGATTTATVGGSPYPIIPTAATGGTFNASNYTLTYTKGNLTVTQSATTITVTSTANPACIGTSVTFKATITPSTPNATGTVQFYDGVVPIGGAITVSGNTASYSSSALTTGNHNITATYSGDGNYSTNTSSPAVVQVINAAAIGNAGSDITSCSGMAAITMSGASANGTYSSVVWSGGAGLGNFTGTGSDPSTYVFTPSVAIGSFTATLTVTAASPCSGTVTYTRKIAWGSTGSWLGITSTDWSDATNWCGGVPITSTDVTIPAVGTVLYQPTISNNDGDCRNITINGALTMSGTIQRGLNVNSTGQFVNNGTFTAGIGKVTFLGAATSIAGSSNTTFYDLVPYNGANITLNNSISISHWLNFWNSGFTGKIITGANVVILTSSSTQVRYAGIGYVYGNLQKIISGNTPTTFEVGDASVFAPVTITFTGGTNNSGSLIVSTTAGDHPQIASSFIDPAKNVNRYWTITNLATLPVKSFSSYSTVFNFVPADYTGANYNNFTVENYNASAWTLLTTGTKTATSTQATGITTFGDFQVGEEIIAPCGPGGNSLVGGSSNIIFCIAAPFPTPEQTVSMSANQFFTMDVIGGMTYQVYTGGASNTVGPVANRLTLNIYDDGGTNSLITSSSTNASNPKGGSANNVFIQFTPVASGRVRILLNQRVCNATTPSGITVYTRIFAGANTVDDQNAAGNNTWIGHIYNGTNSGIAYTNPFSPYLGYNVENTETFDEGFGAPTGNDVLCYPVFSNGVQRASQKIANFAVRFRMNSTRHGLYTVDMGSDDGSRLAIDGQLVYNNWVPQGWTNKVGNLISLSGTSSLQLDYFEAAADNRMTFNNLTLILSNTLSGSNLSQSVCSGSSGTSVSGDTFGTLPSGLSIQGTGYQWTYSTDPAGARTPITGATGATYIPAATAPFDVPGIYYIYRNASLTSVNNFGVVNYVGTNESNAITLTVTANSLTAPLIIGGNPTVCINHTTPAFSTTATGGTWTTINGTGTITIDPATAIVTGVTSGIAQVGYTITDGVANGCIITGVLPITITPSPIVYNVTITGGGTTGSYCPSVTGLSITLSNSQTNVNYQLLKDGTAAGLPIVGSTGTSLVFPISTTAGTYTILATYTDGTGCTTVMSGSIVIAVYNLPSAALTVDNATSCKGDNITFTALPNTFTNYVFLNGATILNQGPANTFSSTTIPNGATITVVVTDANGCTNTFATTPASITVNDRPTGTFKASENSGKPNDNTICTASTVNFSFDNPLPAYINYEFKNITTGIDIYNGPNAYCSTIALANGDQVSLIVSTATCTQTFGPITFTVNPYPDAAGSLTVSSATVCQGQNSVIYTVGAIANTNVNGYQWTVPTGASIVSGQGTTSITVNYSTTALSGNVVVTGTNDCGSGGATTFPVTVNPLPDAAGTITGDATVCQGATAITYSIPIIANSTSYSWNYSGTGATISSTVISGGIASVTIDFAPNATLGNLTVSGTNPCGNGIVSANFPVAMNLLPSAAGTISGTTSVCVGSNGVSYSLTPVNGATSYTWAYSGTGATINGTTDPVTIDFAANATSGILTVVGTNGCGNGIASADYNITINPLPTGSLAVSETSGNVNNDGTICAGASITFTATLTNGTGKNYEFFVGGLSAQNSTSNTFTTTNITTNTTVSVIVTNTSGCFTTFDPVNVTVNPLPNVTISGSNTICAGSTGNLYNTEIGQNNYLWTINGGSIDLGAGTDQVSVTWFPTGTKSLNVNYVDNNGCSSDKTATFTIPPTFTPTITPGSNSPFCLNSTITYSTEVGEDDYNWVVIGGTTLGSTSNSISVTWDQSAGPHSVSVNYSDHTTHCSAVSPTVLSVTVNPLPTAAISGTASVCQGAASPNITFTGSAGMREYTFSYNITGDPTTYTATTSGSDTKTVGQSTTVAGIFTYNLISVTDGNGCVQSPATGSATITVTAPPSATISYSDPAFCKTSGTANVTLGGTTGGTFSSTPAGLTLAADGTITPSSSNAGIYTVKYAIAPLGGCNSFSTSVNVTITNLPTASISYSSSNYCQSVTATQSVTRTGTGAYTGGTYTALPAGLSIDASTGAITPNTSTAGLYHITYSTPASGGCGVVTTMFDVTITAVPDVSVSYATPLCNSSTSASVIYTGGIGAYSGGSFAATPALGLTIDPGTGIINPSTSTPGTYSINYLIPATGGCGSVLKSTSVVITAAPTSNAGAGFNTCAASGTVTIPDGVATNYSSVTWSVPATADGTIGNPNSLSGATYTPGPNDISNGGVTLKLTVAGNGNCASVSTSELLTISPNPVAVVINPTTATYCVGVIVPLTSVDAAGVTGGTKLFNSGTNNVAIPDNNYTGINNTINIPAGSIPANAIINSIGVTLNITHPNDRDIIVNLLAPNAPNAFFNQLNLINSLAGANFNSTVINSTSSQPIQNFGTAPYTGTYAPNAVFGALGSAFATTFSQLYSTGGTVNGNWVLNVADNGAGQTGTLNSWSISITYSVPITPVPVKWSPATDLYTDAAATMPYVAGATAGTVYAKPATAGTRIYTATAGNGAGCETSAYVTLTGKPAPSVYIQANYCDDPLKRVILTAITPDPVSYNWSNGATTPITYVDVAHNYSVSVTNSQGCVGTNNIDIAQELVINGDFSLGNVGFTSQYYYQADVAGNNELVNDKVPVNNGYGVGTNGQNYHPNFWGQDHTNNQTGARNFMIVNGHGTYTVWEETVAVQPNTDYYYSAWAMNLNNVPTPTGKFASLRFEVNGVQIGTTADLGSAPKPSKASDVNLNNWVRFYYGGFGAWNSGTNTTATIRIVDLNSELQGNDFGLDDISFATLSPFVTGPMTPGTDNQVVCSEQNIAPIVYKVGSGASGPDIIGLPADMNAMNGNVTYDGLNFTISGSSIYPGTYNYTITTGGSCANPKAATGKIVINPSAIIALTSDPTTVNQTACINGAILPITYNITGGGSGGGVTWTPHQPAGLGGFYNGGVYTISGIPTEAGTFTYTVTTTGSCLQKTATGTIIVSPAAVGGTVNSPTLCLGDNANLTLTGNLGNVTGWDFSSDGGTSWTPITGTSGLSAISFTITGPSAFRAITTNGACVVPANSSIGKVQINNFWEGKFSTIWTNPANWSSGNTPNINDCSNTVTIPKGVVNDPILTTVVPVTNMNILTNGHLIVNGIGNLQVGGAIANTGGILDATSGGIEYNGSAAQTIASGTFLNNAINDFKISNTNTTSGVSMNGPIDVYRSLTFGAGGKILNTNDQLTIKSTATQTAWVGDMTGHTVNGKVTVERYIGIPLKWQLLAVPTKTTQTIQQAWQENLVPGIKGFGTNITGPTGAGFDFSSPAYSMKYWDITTNDFKVVNSTIQQFPNKDEGYFIFIRGDRQATANLATPHTSTVMRTTGDLNTGNYPITVPANTYFSVGNPYASSVSFSNIGGVSGVGGTYYAWDPLLTGTQGVGGYQTLSSANGYMATAGGTAYYVKNNLYPDIQSGQAFYVNTLATPATLTFNEGAKVSGSHLVFRGADVSARQFFRTYLYLASGKIADGNAVVFDNQFSNRININDARKPLNGGENIGLMKDGILLSVETRSMPTVNDTLYYNVSNLTRQTYQLSFEPDNMGSNNLTAYLVDNYLKTSTPVSLLGTNTANFTVNTDAASAAANRFMIVFKQQVVLPVTFVSVKATQKDKDVVVEWNVENESNMMQYEVEKSIDGINFIKTATVTALNKGTASYQWLDQNVTPGYNYYRIRSIDKNGKIAYSTIVKVLISNITPSISIYPNPITDGIIHLQFVNQPQGRYGIRMMNSLGQLIVSKQISHAGGNASEDIKWDYNLAHGIYHLEVSKPDGEVVVIKVMY